MLSNLVDNALKFTGPNGHVTIRGGTFDGRPSLIVEDDGIGIPGESREKIFNRFYQVDRGRSRELGGTGLGLSIVKHLMRLHGGRVLVSSEVGVGSTFTLQFPAEAAAPSPLSRGA
jgi:two-component system phosphate regulon sensor histidine kinase PhoR